MAAKRRQGKTRELSRFGKPESAVKSMKLRPPASAGWTGRVPISDP
jgi:hypothetical protein